MSDRPSDQRTEKAGDRATKEEGEEQIALLMTGVGGGQDGRGRLAQQAGGEDQEADSHDPATQQPRSRPSEDGNAAPNEPRDQGATQRC